MIATEQGGRGASGRRGRSAFLDQQVQDAMQRLLALEDVQTSSHRRSVGGGQLHYLEAGSGPPILLLHGAGGGAANWYRLIKPLARTFRVIAVDLPGFGLSDVVEPKAPLGREIARRIAQLLTAVDVQPVHVIGTSFGGLVGVRLTEHVMPNKLVLIDAAGLWPEASLGLRLACIPFIQRLGVKQTRRGARLLLRHVLTGSRLPPEHESALAEYIFASAARSDVRLMARAYSLFGGWRGQREVLTETELRKLGSRMLIIWGERDRFLPAPMKRRTSALTTGARVHIIPGAGHSPNWETPEQVLKAITDFLQEK